MSWLVLPPDDATWTIPAEDFKRELERTWPGATARIEPRFNTSVDYEIPMQHSRIWGYLDRAGQVLSFDADPLDGAKLALWFRTLVPPQHPLIFCDQGYTYDIALTSETTPEDILRAFKIEPS